jgi:hypothetical protein
MAECTFQPNVNRRRSLNRTTTSSSRCIELYEEGISKKKASLSANKLDAGTFHPNVNKIS